MQCVFSRKLSPILITRFSNGNLLVNFVLCRAETGRYSSGGRGSVAGLAAILKSQVQRLYLGGGEGAELCRKKGMQKFQNF